MKTPLKATSLSSPSRRRPAALDHPALPYTAMLLLNEFAPIVAQSTTPSNLSTSRLACGLHKSEMSLLLSVSRSIRE
eukprot:scaffold368_cov258-Pinguiococcus_pyrenoidosus.AAC.18